MWLILVIFILTLLYYIIQKPLGYWKNRGVPGPTPFPLVGNIGKSIIGAKSIGEIVEDIYRNYEEYSFVGIYQFGTPALIVRDTDFIKKIMVKDFKYFQNNDIIVDKELDPLFGRNPFVLKGEEWKQARTQLTHCFTSGKMKNLFQLIEKVSKAMVIFVENQKEATRATGMEAKELCTKFTLDSVALCAFGLEGKCFEDPKSEFRNLAHRFLSPDAWVTFKFMLMMVIPKLSNFCSLKIVPKDVEDQLLGIVKMTIKYREENNIVRNDFLDYVHELSKTSSHFTEIDITAHAASFFGDGYETSSLVMSYLLFELGINLDVQSKLRDEINNCFEKNDKNLPCEAILGMPYLDACLNESMRMHLPLYYLGKRCNERYTYTPSNPDYKNISVTIEPDTSIILPVSGLHMDPKYFYSPEKYIPERFLDKETINRYAYLPFGEGPRSCLGQRFGLMQIKVGVTHLIKNFEIKVTEKTKLPLEFDPWYFLRSVKGGLWLNFNKI